MKPGPSALGSAEASVPRQIEPQPSAKEGATRLGQPSYKRARPCVAPGGPVLRHPAPAGSAKPRAQCPGIC